MRITSKGQVTIPIELRRQLGLLPGVEVDFILDEGGVRIVRSDANRRGEEIVKRLRGTSTVKLNTDEVMAGTRGEDFLAASRRLRSVLKSSVDSTEVIRADRDRDTR